MTESKLWNYIKMAILRGFRIESATHLGIPDVFAVLPSGRTVWIENKIVRSGKDLLDFLRPGQRTFREDYDPYIPCIVLGVQSAYNSKIKILVADVHGQRITVCWEGTWKAAVSLIISRIDKELSRERKTEQASSQSGRTGTPENEPGAGPTKSVRRVKAVD